MSEDQGFTQRLADPRVNKGLQSATGMFKGLLSAIPGVGALADLIMTIVDATGVLKPLQGVLDAVMGLFGIMGAQIIPVLMTAIRPLLDLIMSMKSYFVMLGSFLGVLIQIALIPFILAIKAMQMCLEPLLPVFDAFTPIFQALNPIISAFIQILTPLIPILFPMVAVFKALNPLIAEFSRWLTTIARILGWKGSSSSGSYQSGTDYVPRTGQYTLHRGESVGRRGGRGETEELLSELVTLTKKQIKQNAGYSEW